MIRGKLIYLKILAAGFWRIHCGPLHAGCCICLCSSALLGCTSGTVSHSQKQTQHYLLGSLQRRTHLGPKGGKTENKRKTIANNQINKIHRK